jgi:hypothetical protein
MTHGKHHAKTSEGLSRGDSPSGPVQFVVGWGEWRLALRMRWFEREGRKGRLAATKLTIRATIFVYVMTALHFAISSARFGWPDMSLWPQVAALMLALPFLYFVSFFPVGWIVDLTMPWRDEFRGYVVRCAAGLAAVFVPGFLFVSVLEKDFRFQPMLFVVPVIAIVGGLFGVLVWYWDKTKGQTRSHDL